MFWWNLSPCSWLKPARCGGKYSKYEHQKWTLKLMLQLKYWNLLVVFNSDFVICVFVVTYEVVNNIFFKSARVSFNLSHCSFRTIIGSHHPDLRPNDSSFFNFSNLRPGICCRCIWNSRHLYPTPTQTGSSNPVLYAVLATACCLGQSDFYVWCFSNLVSDWVWGGQCFIQHRLRFAFPFTWTRLLSEQHT
jgi:hypothetical protein